MKPLLFLIGPTASGKTAYALRWAQENDAEILSCDACCVYRGMDIGTAKPSPLERAQVVHHGLDLVSVDRCLSVAEYAVHARKVVEDSLVRGKQLVIVGGSGFYLKSFFSPVTDQIVIPDDLRREVEMLLQEKGLNAVLGELDRLHPRGTDRLDRRNPRRVVNALLRCRASGLTLPELAEQFARQPPPYPHLPKEVWLLQRTPQEMSERIESRTRGMLEAGLIEEVAALRKEGLERNPSAASAIGYRETLQYLDGKGDRQWLQAEIVRHTRQLVRKQQTWFRTQIRVDRILSGSNVRDYLEGRALANAG